MAFSFRSAVPSAALLALSLAAPLCAHAQPVTSRLSTGFLGDETNNGSGNPRISADGNYVVFRSDATNLVPDDTNQKPDIFITQISTGSTRRVNVANDGSQTTGVSPTAGVDYGFAVSANGRYVVFSTTAKIDPADTNNLQDIYVRDTVANTTTLITKGIGGAQTNSGSYAPTLSADGRYLAFESVASNLYSGDTNNAPDIFLYDRVTNALSVVSTNTGGGFANGSSTKARISGDGNSVAFYSSATNLVSGDTNGASDVFVRSLNSGTTSLASVTTAGAQGHGNSGFDSIAISYNGKIIAFDSLASDLVSGDTNGTSDVFVRDITNPFSPTTTRVSLSAAGTQSGGINYLDAMTPDGRFILFETDAILVGSDTNADYDLFIRDRTAANTIRVSIGLNDESPNNQSSFGDISGDGNKVVFRSFATNLVAGDTNMKADIFLRTPLLQTAVISGTLLLQQIVESAPNQTFTFTFRNSTSEYVQIVSVPANGGFVINTLPRGMYTVLITGGNYLAKKLTIDSSAGDTTLPAITLRGGDSNRDNVVDVADLLAIIYVYNKTISTGGYLASADFNLDGANDVTDLLIVISNYNQSGDSL